MTGQNDLARKEAAAWLVRLESESASEQDWLAFEGWMASPQNKAAYEALEATMQAVDAQRDALADGLKQRAPPITRRRVALPIWITGAVAAAAMAAAVIMFAPPKPQELAYAAPPTSVRLVTLPDGSLIQLNRGAAVRVRLDSQSRRVALAQGEASFTVRHDEARPFEVVAGSATIRDLGTEFDVVHAQNYVTVTVRTGRIVLTPVGGQARGLGAGQQGRLDNNAGAVAVSQTNPDDAFGWQSGRLIYRDAPLSQIVEDLNRYSRQPIVIADPRASQLRFTGVLVIDDAATMVRRLEAFLPIQSAQDADRIVLRSRQ